MELRPYQKESVEAVFNQWNSGIKRTLLVLPTGCGKTIVFSKIAEQCVRMGHRVLILAHRGELLEQASDKLYKATGLKTALEKAESSCLSSYYRVVVGSIQSLQRESRLHKFSKDYFDTIIVDEAHHVLSDGYQTVLKYFEQANVLGVTATADRGDMRNLGEYFETLAYEYTLQKAIKSGYLSPIKAVTIPLQIDLSSVGIQTGDFKSGDLGTALDPYLEQIANEMVNYCSNRKTVVFTPLIETSKKFTRILNEHGFKAVEVNGESKDRSEILKDFESGKYNVLLNSMLLVEGFDCPSIDCVIVLRPTKVRGLYCLDEKTEVLTKNGWKNDVEIGEEVATFNLKTSEIDFKPTIAKVRRSLEDNEYFCSLKGQSSDIRVTNNHRMIYDNKRRKGWKINTAEYVANLKDGEYIPVAGHNKFKGIPLSDDEIRFIGWVMTDGTINKANNAIAITQNCNQPWLEEIQKCIDGCNLKHNRLVIKHHSQFNSTSDKTIWTISKGKPRGRDKDKRGWGYLEKYISKDLSPNLFEMDNRQFAILLETIHWADGHKQKSDSWVQGSYHICKGNKTFIERLQIMGLMRGYRANISIATKDRKNPLFYLNIKNQDFIRVGSAYGIHSQWVKETPNNEYCWCVQTESGTLVTRRNGKVAIVGNCQMIGRGTRLYPGKTELLVLDFLWHTERHELCHPASLIAPNEEINKAMTKRLEDNAGMEYDLEQLELDSTEDVLRQREEALAEQLAAMKKRKRKFVDPLQFEMSIQAEDLVNYVPAFGYEMGPASKKQLETLEKFGIFTDEIENAGKAQLLLDRLIKRSKEGLTTPKQIRFLEQKGFVHVGTWQFEDAKKLINRIAANHWMVPFDINTETYKPGR